jgi:hypothetical protein
MEHRILSNGNYNLLGAALKRLTKGNSVEKIGGGSDNI